MNKSMISIPKSRIFSLFLIVILSFLLSACGIGDAEMDITLYKEKYKPEIVITLSADEMDYYGGTQAFEQYLNEMVLEGKSEGRNVKWRDITERNSSTYQYVVISDKIKITNSDVDDFTWREIKYDNRKAYEFEYSPYTSILSSFSSYVITLHAGKILATNGTQIDKRTVTWVNSSYVTPYAIVIPKGSGGWVWIVLALVLLVAVGLVLYKLIKTEKLQNWATSVINAGKWKIEETKLNSEVKSLEKDKDILVSELGKKAWEERVVHPAYSEPYSQLENLDQQASALNTEITDLNANLQDVRNKFSQTKAEFFQKIGQLQDSHKIADENLGTSKKNLDDLEKLIIQNNKDQDKLEAEISNYEKKLAEIQASNVEDKESKAISLNSAIATINKKLMETTAQLPELQTKISALRNEQQPLVEKINKINDQINQTQAAQKAALQPIEEQLAALEKNLNEKKAILSDLKNKMNSIISELGPLVNSARPASEGLTSLYYRIDSKVGDLATKSENKNLLIARLNAIDKSDYRNFFLTVGGLIIAFVLIILFLILGF